MSIYVSLQGSWSSRNTDTNVSCCHRRQNASKYRGKSKGKEKVKLKVGYFYSATYAAMPRPAALYNRRKWQLIGKSQWCCSAVLQLQHTPPPQSTTPGLHPVSIHQMAPPVRGSKHPITAYYSVYRPQKDERLSQPAWLVTYRNKVPPPGIEPGHVTHPSTNRARRRVTSLIRPTPLALRHAANTQV